jgi:hypothetical protein
MGEKMFMMKSEVVCDDLIQNVDQKISEKRRFTISKLCLKFHKFHALFAMRLSQLG